jgi:hypothetical protein
MVTNGATRTVPSPGGNWVGASSADYEPAGPPGGRPLLQV